MTTQIIKRIWRNGTCHSVIGWRIQEIVKNLTIWHYEEFFFHIVFSKKVGPTSDITGWILKSNLMRLHTVHYTIRTKCKMKWNYDCRASSLRHLPHLLPREDCCSNSWYSEVVRPLLTSAPPPPEISYPSWRAHKKNRSSVHVARSSFITNIKSC